MTGRSVLPEGTVTFVFTDIEGSTRLMRDLGAADYAHALSLHRRLLRDVWASHAGAVVDNVGDAFLVVFESAGDGYAAAVAAQRALAAAEWPEGVPFRVRIGMHTGPGALRDGRYVSLAVHQAARIVDAAHGGQILLSDATRSALGDAEPVDDLGRFAVRDFDEPVHLHRVRPDGWSGPTRLPRARPADGHNIPRPLTSLVGREEDLAWLTANVGPGRLVSLVGPGGVGKTRLATEFGLAAAGDWRDGVWFVDLVATRTAPEVEAALADAVGAKPQPGRPVLDDALAHLEDRQALIILDNCEHVHDAAALAAARLLAVCPAVALLATSQSSLGLHGQPERRLLPLSVEGDDPPAVRLFQQRAGDVAPDELGAVRSLCEFVDGLPLAIELVAARSGTVRPAAALELLRDHGASITVGDPTLPERHRSLDSVLDWSRNTLDPAGEVVLRRLAVFTGSFTLQDAITACADAELAPPEVLDLLLSLIDRSLVIAHPASGGSRFRLLAQVRGYARALRMPEEAEHSAASLAALYLDRVGPERATNRGWMSELADELDNVRGVIRDLANHDDETAQRLAWSIAELHAVRSAVATGCVEAQEHLTMLPAPTPARVALLGRAATLLGNVGEMGRAAALLEEADHLAETVGAPGWDEAGHLRARGDLLLRRGDFAAAADLAREILGGATTARARAKGWNLLGIALASEDDLESAAESFTQELVACREGHFDLYAAIAEGNVAEVYYRLGRWAEAARHERAVLEISRVHGRDHHAVYAIVLAARMLGAAEDHAAVALEYAAAEAAREAGFASYETDEAVREEHLRSRSARMGLAAFQEAREAGRAMDVDAALAMADTILEQIEWEGRAKR